MGTQGKQLALPGRAEDPTLNFQGLVPFILIKESEWKPRACPFTEDMKRPIAIFPVMAKQTFRKMYSHLNFQATFGDPLEAWIAEG